jgi:hypothetical protein
LGDPSPVVRRAAVDMIQYRLPSEMLSKATLKLEEMENADPDAEVRKRARWAGKQIRGEPYV